MLVTGRRQRDWVREENIRMDKINEKFINMYISNFPEDWTAEPLKEILEKKVGRVADVMIPLKKSKNGKSFAFVRFVRVGDEAALIQRAKGVWIGLYKLLANVARFNKMEKSGAYQNGIQNRVEIKKNERWNLKGQMRKKEPIQEVWRRKSGTGGRKEVRTPQVVLNKTGHLDKDKEKEGDKMQGDDEESRDEMRQNNSWVDKWVIVEPKAQVDEVCLQNLLRGNGHVGFQLARLTEEQWALEHPDEKARLNLLNEEENRKKEWFRSEALV